jgi:hypothetical protein
MSKARDIANILSANTAIATDAEVTAAISSATSGLATSSSVSTAVTNERTASATLTNKTIDGNSNALSIKRGTTAQRPASATTGDQYFDTTEQALFNYTSSGWQRVSKLPAPTLSSISPTTASSAGTSITVNGTNFVSGAVVSFVGTDSITRNSTSTTFVSGLVLTAITPQLPVSAEPYDVIVTNPDSQFVSINDALDAGSVPTWNTTSGSLGSVLEGFSKTFTALSASDSDGNTISYTSNNIPAWASLNSSTGVISVSSAPLVSSDTTYTFDVLASDGTNSSSRSFSITVTDSSNTVDVFGDGSGKALWKLDNTALDVSGNYNGSITSVTFDSTVKKLGTHSAQFGTDRTISIPTIVNNYPFTVSLWATCPNWYFTTEGQQEMFNAGLTDQGTPNGSGGKRISLGLTKVNAWNNGNTSVTLMYGGVNHTGADVPDGWTDSNAWHHIVWVVRGDSDGSIYLDGVSQTVLSFGGGHGGTAGWNIGSNSNNPPDEEWPGRLDHVRFFNKALNSSEVAQLYNSGSGL